MEWPRAWKPYPGIWIDHLPRSIHLRASPLTETAHMQSVRRSYRGGYGRWTVPVVGPVGTRGPRPGTNCDFIIIAPGLSLRPSFFFLLQHRREVLGCLMATDRYSALERVAHRDVVTLSATPGKPDFSLPLPPSGCRPRLLRRVIKASENFGHGQNCGLIFLKKMSSLSENIRGHIGNFREFLRIQ